MKTRSRKTVFTTALVGACLAACPFVGSQAQTFATTSAGPILLPHQHVSSLGKAHLTPEGTVGGQGTLQGTSTESSGVDPPFRASQTVTNNTIAITGGASLASSFTATDWNTFAFNPQRSGYNSYQISMRQTHVPTDAVRWR